MFPETKITFEKQRFWTISVPFSLGLIYLRQVSTAIGFYVLFFQDPVPIRFIANEKRVL